jgi:hypothetical protein
MIYLERLTDELRGDVLDEQGTFCCRSGPVCRSSVKTDGFAAGQMSYVGDHYAPQSGYGPLRILVVSMQVGDDQAPVTMTQRRQQVRTRIPERFGQRNQHMAGVTTALPILFGAEPGSDRDGEFLDTPAGPVHVLDAYAMANSVLCSRRPGAGREGAPSPTMITNCGRHLRATIEALEPTIIHSQGRAASWSTHQAVERITDDAQQLDEHLSRVRVGSVEAIWCSLRHPSRNWAQLGRSYLRDTAAPALRRARCIALGD